MFLTFLYDVWAKLRWRAVLLITAQIANGLVEGLGFTLLFPLLALLGIGGGESKSTVARLVDDALGWLGIPHTLPVILSLIVGVFLIQNVLFLLQSWLVAHYQTRYTEIWRNNLFRAIMRARWRFFARSHSGQLVNTLLRETNRLNGAFFVAAQIAVSLAFILVYLALAIASAWQVALVLTGFGIAMFLLTRPLIRLGGHVGVEMSRRGEELQTYANEFLGGAKLVKASATEDLAASWFREAVRGAFRLDRWAFFHPNLLRSIYEVSGIVVLCLMLGVGLEVLNLDAAAILVTIYLYVRLYSRISVVQQNLQSLNIHLPAIVTALDAQQRAEAEQEPGGPDEPAEVSSVPTVGVAVRVENLVAGHGGPPVLHRIDLSIPSGEVVGVTGSSGAGKSTLVDCLLGLIPPDSGRILVTGTPLDDLPIKAWRRSVGYVAQETVLFHRTVRENLRWGNENATDEEIVEAARRAHAHEFILSMPQGYDTVVGDRGVRMSGGQRQRLGLARALVGHKALLLLDEATSALDSEAEAVVIDAIEELRGRITVILVAHRLSTLRKANRIYVLDHGYIVEAGTWEELEKRGKHFSAAWGLQSRVS